MLTRREFLSICMVMGALFFLFQFLNVMRQKWNSTLRNLHAADRSTLKNAAAVYRPAAGTADCIVYLGAPDAPARQAAADWALYQKWELQCAETFAELEAARAPGAALPRLVVADLAAEHWANAAEIACFRRFAEQGVHVVVPQLPPLAVLEQDAGLCALLGIRRIRSRTVTAKGVHLYEGFLLGGETIYAGKTEQERKRQDLPLEMPWLTLTSGTKVYMKAILDDPDVDVQEEPPLLWRKSSDEGFVFVVNGDYFQGVTGLGLLAAMLNETQEITAYPVLNAQNLILGNAPVFADENDAVFQQRYSQSMRGALRDLFWASISRVASGGIFGLTCMATPQMEYQDASEPQQKDLLYYLRLVQTLGGEVGLSGWRHDETSIAEKLRQDAAFWNEQAEEYRFASFYRADLSEEELRTALAQPLLRAVQTVVEQPDGESSLIGYRTDDVTEQKAVAGGFVYTHRDDLRVKCAETALGYTSVLTDLKQVFYPQTAEDGWETLSREFTANTMTYWKPFAGFARTTAAETDVRIREFLALQPHVRMEEEQLELKAAGAALPAWFLVRTHGQEPTQMEGGTFRKLEPNVFLVELAQPNARLDFRVKEERYYTP